MCEISPKYYRDSCGGPDDEDEDEEAKPQQFFINDEFVRLIQGLPVVADVDADAVDVDDEEDGPCCECCKAGCSSHTAEEKVVKEERATCVCHECDPDKYFCDNCFCEFHDCKVPATKHSHNCCLFVGVNGSAKQWKLASGLFF
jgi:hypothetical protein